MGSRSNIKQCKNKRLNDSSTKDDRTTNIEYSNNKENQITAKLRNKFIVPEKLLKQTTSSSVTKQVEIKEEVVDHEYDSNDESN
jgi:glycogen debranching enzyme